MSKTPPPSNETCCCSQSAAFLILRGWLGVRALITGIEKFSGTITVQQPLLDDKGVPDPSGAVVEVETKVYGLSHYHAIPQSLQDKFANEPLLPALLTKPFYASLGYVLIALGLMLLLGLWTRASLFGMGILYIMLTVGLILIGQDAGVSWLAIHIALIAMALCLASHNRLALTRS